MNHDYTFQNIDTLERVAGLPEEKLVEAHGSFHSAHCVNCRKEYAHEWVKGIKNVLNYNQSLL